MEYIKANIEDLKDIVKLVQNTIESIYPKYYPRAVVDFFIHLHKEEKIKNDIEENRVFVLYEGNIIIGTATFDKEHINRLYVLPEFQGRGYGNFLMDFMEKEISKKYKRAVVEASLPASFLYDKRGYKTIERNKEILDNDAVLVYEVMEKILS